MTSKYNELVASLSQLDRYILQALGLARSSRPSPVRSNANANIKPVRIACRLACHGLTRLALVPIVADGHTLAQSAVRRHRLVIHTLARGERIVIVVVPQATGRLAARARVGRTLAVAFAPGPERRRRGGGLGGVGRG